MHQPTAPSSDGVCLAAPRGQSALFAASGIRLTQLLRLSARDGFAFETFADHVPGRAPTLARRPTHLPTRRAQATDEASQIVWHSISRQRPAPASVTTIPVAWFFSNVAWRGRANTRVSPPPAEPTT